MPCGTRIITICLILLAGAECLVSPTMRYELDLNDSSPVQFGYPLESHQTPMTDVSKPLLGDQAFPKGSEIVAEWYIRNFATEQLTVAVEYSSFVCESSYILISEVTESEDGFEPRQTKDVLQCGKVTSRVVWKGHGGRTPHMINAQHLINVRLAPTYFISLYELGGRMISHADVVVVRLVCTSQTSQCPAEHVTLTAKAETTWALDKQCYKFMAVNLTSETTVYTPLPLELIREIWNYITPDYPREFPQDFIYDYQTLERDSADCWHIHFDMVRNKTVILEVIQLDLSCELGHMVLEQKSVYFSGHETYERLDTFNMCGDGDGHLVPGQKCVSNMTDLHIYPVFKTNRIQGWGNSNFTLRMEAVDALANSSETHFPHCNNYSFVDPESKGKQDPADGDGNSSVKNYIIALCVVVVVCFVGACALFYAWRKGKFNCNEHTAPYLPPVIYQHQNPPPLQEQEHSSPSSERSHISGRQYDADVSTFAPSTHVSDHELHPLQRPVNYAPAPGNPAARVRLASNLDTRVRLASNLDATRGVWRSGAVFEEDEESDASYI